MDILDEIKKSKRMGILLSNKKYGDSALVFLLFISLGQYFKVMTLEFAY
jgi:hypothetical protein